jgi:hyaluronoglucosaminidase
LIDNSDKGFSFSNYWMIDRFPWAEVRGRTYNYPFSEGDVPDSARYVRLFFGLKGIGAMWIDDIDYRYSKWNFTALERFKPYFAKPLTLDQSIIPTPQSFQQINDVLFYEPSMPDSSLPVIVLPENPGPADYSAAKILQQKIDEVLGRLMPAGENNRSKSRIVEYDFSFNDILNAKLVFSIGKNKTIKKVQPHLPLTAVQDKLQGYIIKSARVGHTDIVFLYGETALARYYAAATAIQLFDGHKAVYHNATVVDYPDFLGRSYVFKNWKNSGELQNDLVSLARLSLYKLNKVYLGYNRPAEKWHQADELYRKGIKEAGRLCRKSGVMSLAMMVNPYSHLGFEPSAANFNDQLRYRWTHGSPASFEMLKALYRMALDAGAETIMLQSDDSVPHAGRNRRNYSLYTVEDKNRFVSLQNAHAHVINKLKQWIDSEYPGTRLEFCPPWYSNEHIDHGQGKAEFYFHDLVFQIPRDVAIIWTGPTIRSLSIDMADLYRYKSLIGRWPMFWDNTLYARNLEARNYGGYPTHYPRKVRMCNLFEPYDTRRPQEFQKYSDGRQMYTNGSADTEVYKIKYATVADYEWNTAAYNPELALWKALTQSYGRAAAERLLRFSDAYYGVFEMCFRIKSAGANSEYIENAEKFLAGMRQYLKDISTELPGQTSLLKELEYYLKKQEKRFAESVNRPDISVTH